MNSSFWMILGNGGYALFQVLVMMFISKFLGVDELGYFSLALAITAPIMLFSTFGLRTLWITDQSKVYSYFQFRKIRIITSLLALLACIFVSLLYASDLAFTFIIIIVAACKVIENQSDLYYGLMHKKNMQKKISYSLLIRSASGFIGIVVGIFLFGDLVAALLIYCLCWFISFLIADVYLNRDFIKGHSSQVVGKNNTSKSILIAGLPLAVAFLLINTNLMIPRLALSEIVSIKELGVYAALAYFVQIGTIIINSIGQAALPSLSKMYLNNEYREHKIKVVKVIGVIFFISWSGALFSYLYSDYILEVFFGELIAQKNDVLILMFLLAPAQYAVSIMGHVLSSIGKNKSLVFSQWILVISNVILSIALIPVVGIYGAVYALFGANLLALTFYVYFYLRGLKND
jgi:O-antigen/teichoic acid export membrane protein